MKFYYYKITNIENGRFYIGITTNFEKRKKEHTNNLIEQLHPNYKLQGDFNKYGLKAFKFEIIEELDSSGAFLVKGAVKDVAAILGCSQATIYRYLSNVKK